MVGESNVQLKYSIWLFPHLLFSSFSSQSSCARLLGTVPRLLMDPTFLLPEPQSVQTGNDIVKQFFKKQLIFHFISYRIVSYISSLGKNFTCLKNRVESVALEITDLCYIISCKIVESKAVSISHDTFQCCTNTATFKCFSLSAVDFRSTICNMTG